MGEEKEDRSEILSKLEELNRKIVDLRERENREQFGIVREGVKKRKPEKVFSLDYIDSDNLLEIEMGIKETMEGLLMSKEALCKALSNIDRKKLYRQIGADNFMQYLSMERIPLNYKTAKEYAKIGYTLIRYSEELNAADFREEDGLKKLVYVDKALENTPEEKKVEVFRRVKESSLRDFQRWVRENGKPSEKEGEGAVDEMGVFRGEFRIFGCSIVRDEGGGEKVPAVSVNRDAMGMESTDELFHEFMSKLLSLTKYYYEAKRKELDDEEHHTYRG